ncbi:Scr1 family TA system antitoxin-like transcriptional regulator [Streptomyces sp. NPDC092296]|uniref:helix-turn-helix domain-containing protein n=1 Tax=Streptomyces sp. NPDC092296 TaxID=3366012 RepID=UPI0037FB17C2
MGIHASDDSGKSILKGFGRQVKILREREGLTQLELSRKLGYSEDTIASIEQGRRVAQPDFIDSADAALKAGGLLMEMKKPVSEARFPAFFRDYAVLEGEAAERYAYDTVAFDGLLQTEDYARAVYAMRRPVLGEEAIEQGVASRMARQEVLYRKPAGIFGFVVDESVLRRPYGGHDVQQGQLGRLLDVGQLRNVELQVMPLDREDNAGAGGPFTLLTPRGRQQVAYLEGQSRSTLITDQAEVRDIAIRYGVLRAQALTPRESLAFIEKMLGEV